MRRAQLEGAGVRTIAHVLASLPLRYEDRSKEGSLEGLDPELLPEEPVAFTGRLVGVRGLRLRRRNQRMVEGRLVTADGEVKVRWFNRPYFERQVRPEATYRLFGKLRDGRSGVELSNPSVEVVEESETGEVVAGALTPIYGRVGEVSPSTFTKLVLAAVEMLREAELDDPLGAPLLERHALPTLRESLLQLHCPDPEHAEQIVTGRSPWHARLIYGELLRQQLALLEKRRTQVARRRGRVYQASEEDLGRVAALLPFELTGAQSRVLAEICSDLERDQPMWRLIQGDVGCGKTAVAVLTLALAMDSGAQVAFMAPTELLAEQHAKTLRQLLAPAYSVELLTGSTPDAAAVRKRVQRGEVQLLLGTHALIQESVEFASLGLAVIDEQHRFGVQQRERLAAKGDAVDLLVMTATPIPRSLALTVYGDLDVSVIDELPPGRTPVDTTLWGPADGGRAMERARREIEAGGQVYWVVPLIESSEELPAQSVEVARQRLTEQLPEARLGVVHGRMSATERDETMGRFERGELDVLLSTTVIEVGVDVANASLMVIESAERFGLSQLHQLRGRVGRGARMSACVALAGDVAPETRERLEDFAATSDGFEIAEADLRRRGPGDVLGTRQSGQPWFRFADPLRDVAWLAKAREDAREIVENGGVGPAHV